MTKRGGGIQTSDIYKNILSIGYELETSDLAKLSLNGEKTLVNSASIFSNQDSIKLDDHYYMFGDNTFENESFVEYFIETKNENTEFDITNDVSTSDIEQKCEQDFGNLTVPKDKLFQVATQNKSYNIVFSSELKEQGKFTFSGVEWIATFYNPPKSKNIILETFVDSLKQLLKHVDNLQTQPCNLYVNKINIDGTEQQRLLYNKPGTDLYYMELHYGRNMNLDEISITPQMTFRSNIVHTVSIMKEILWNEGNDQFMNDYKDIEKVDELVDELIYRFQLKPRKIRLNAHIHNYLVFILYKIYCYINIYTKDHQYFKDSLTFQSRHSNFSFYKQIMTFFQKKYSKEESADLFLELINHPDLIIYYIYGRENRRKVIHETAQKSFLFGDPKISFLSYFKFFEVKQADWFAKLDSKTSSSEIHNHTVLFEYRAFYNEFITFSGMNESEDINLGVFRKFVSSMKDVKNLEDHEFNATTKRWVRKCKPGQERNIKFQCKRTRKNQSTESA